MRRTTGALRMLLPAFGRLTAAGRLRYRNPAEWINEAAIHKALETSKADAQDAGRVRRHAEYV